MANTTTPKTPDAAPTTREKQGEPAPQPTYEQARDELLAVVSRLESGQESLADSMALFQRGEFLVGLCEQYLDSAQASVEATKES